MTLYPVILAGGSGTRLWPLSREHFPKQFLPLMGERTMFQETLSRLDGLEGVAPPLVVCNEVHRFLVTEQMREIGKRPLTVVVEPVGRNTAPALTLAALRLAEMAVASGEDPVMLEMHADNLIGDASVFQGVVQQGIPLAESGHIVTFGVVPTGPETGYGYIRQGEQLDVGGGREMTANSPVYRVSAFAEKPDLETATAHLDAGDYLWNPGIFMMRSSVWLSELERHRPDIAKACRAANSKGRTDGDFYRPREADFTVCPADSIDYAVMEPASGVVHDRSVGGRAPAGFAGCVVVPLDTEWSDVGAWSTLWEERDRDADGNVIQGDVYAQSTKNALLIAQHRLLATIGLEDVVVVETGDAVLVARKDRVQDVKEIVGSLKADGRTEQESHRKVHRPWGAYEIVDNGEGFQVKRLTVNPGAALSLQFHSHRAEHWVVVKGTAKVTRGEEVYTLAENQSTYVPEGTKHRLENLGDVPLEIIEVQSGTYLGEDDIIRLQDNYDRHEYPG